MARNDFSRKIDWVKNHQQEELQNLEAFKKPLEDEIRALNEVLKEKYEELDKIELRASEASQSYLVSKGI